MFVGRRVRFSCSSVLLVVAVICFNLALSPLPARAQAQQIRLGDMRVDWYCLQRGYSAWITNNGNDWACTASSGAITILLNQSDYNSICQNFYSNAAAYAVRDRSSSAPALDWSCYAAIPPTATPTLMPTLQATRLGEFQVEWYCNQSGLGVRLINNNADWACTSPNSGVTVFTLNQNDFNQICRQTYHNDAAYAVRDQNRPQAAYNWSCYVNAPLSTSLPVPTATPALQLTRLGEFQVEWYCTERHLGVRIVNNDADWACIDPATNQVSFVLAQQDFDQICKRTYNDQAAFAVHDQSKSLAAYNWSCYTYR